MVDRGGEARRAKGNGQLLISGWSADGPVVPGTLQNATGQTALHLFFAALFSRLPGFPLATTACYYHLRALATQGAGHVASPLTLLLARLRLDRC